MSTSGIIPYHQGVIYSRPGRFEKRPYKAAPHKSQLSNNYLPGVALLDDSVAESIEKLGQLINLAL